MPVIARSRSGRPVRFTIRNVRCVPSFKYTLLSVDQLWEESNIDSVFRGEHHLQFPEQAGSMQVPFDPYVRLNSVVLISVARLQGGKSDNTSLVPPSDGNSTTKSVNVTKQHQQPNRLPPSKRVRKVSKVVRIEPVTSPRLNPISKTISALLGYHQPGSTAHVARLPPAQAGELLHRRSHLGHTKINAMPDTCKDAPKC